MGFGIVLIAQQYLQFGERNIDRKEKCYIFVPIVHVIGGITLGLPDNFGPVAKIGVG